MATGSRDAEGRLAYPAQRSEADRIEQVSGAIDSGKTGDKVAVADPAAAPLGSDAEAGQGHDEAGLKASRRATAKPIP